MSKPTTILYALAMVALILALDLTILRHHVLARLITNVAIVIVFGTIYALFLRHR